MFETLFSFLFKYPRLVFEQGDFVFGATRSMSLAAIVIALAAAYAIWTYRQLVLVRGRDRATLLAIRTALFGLVVFGLLQPMLLLKVAIPQQNFVGVLLDDSRSMQVADVDGGPRSGFVLDRFGRTDSPILTELGKRFTLRVYRFSSSAERLQSTSDLTFAGTGTRLGDAVDRARDELTGLPVAGLVVVSDGADNAGDSIDESLAALRAQAIPVFTVGVGEERLSRDVQVTRVNLPRRVLKGTALVIDVVVTQTGYAGRTVPLVVEDAGRVVSEQEITLPPDGESETVRVRFKASEKGPRVFRFRIPAQAGEEVPQNNQRDLLTEVYDGRQKILYLEGEPRPEAKFVRLATADDENIQVVLLQRTAEATVRVPDKFLRLGVDSGEELINGFPTTREELYEYRAIILGTIEAGAFTPDQQRMLEDFVDVRGGTLLALGGRRSFSEGGWGGTPLSNALPVTLDRGVRPPFDPPLEVVVRPTPAGASHPATQIADTEANNAAKWRDLPPLTILNGLGAVKPGANVLLTGIDERGREQVVLAHQRYGRGKAMVLTPQDTWLWRMHAKMALEDTTHFTFWQRLTRWMVDDVPERVMASTSPDTVERGDPFTINAEVLDKEYKGINDGRITARVTQPSGRVEEIPLDWTVEQDGEYRGRFTPTEDGVHTIAIGGTSRDGGDVGRGTVSIRVAPSEAEYFDAAMRAPLLRRIAEETKGRFLRANETDQLADAISYSGSGITVVEERELWDMPILLIVLLGLMGSEWLYRRAKGLA
ncbi:MAG: hypothetical protein R2752_10120 [Vicinamibacterales bacterium]